MNLTGCWPQKQVSCGACRRSATRSQMLLDLRYADHPRFRAKGAKPRAPNAACRTARCSLGGISWTLKLAHSTALRACPEHGRAGQALIGFVFLEYPIGQILVILWSIYVYVHLAFLQIGFVFSPSKSGHSSIILSLQDVYVKSTISKLALFFQMCSEP